MSRNFNTGLSAACICLVLTVAVVVMMVKNIPDTKGALWYVLIVIVTLLMLRITFKAYYYGKADDRARSVLSRAILIDEANFYHIKKTVRGLVAVCDDMANDQVVLDGLMNVIRDSRITSHVDINQLDYEDIFFDWLLLDIHSCYSSIGADVCLDYLTQSGQMVWAIILSLQGEDVYNSYSDFTQGINDSEYHSHVPEKLRSWQTRVFGVLCNGHLDSSIDLSSQSHPDMRLVMLTKMAHQEDVYLDKLRELMFDLAQGISQSCGMTERATEFMADLKKRRVKDKIERLEKNDSTEELENLIGLSQVKSEVQALRHFIEINNRRQEAGMKTPLVSYHSVFTGNPGTGKTTVARIVARIYKELGVLKKGHLVETDRAGLVAEYVGQTAVKTNKVIDQALDGVLFIDEAYSLVSDMGGDYGPEAISTLVKRMEDDRDRLIVILAGYQDEMEQFIESNPGLRSRFTRYIHFEDYSAQELFEIFMKMLQRYDFRLQPGADGFLMDHLKKCTSNKPKDFGNARYVRNLFERVINAQANRLAKSASLSKEDLATISISDILESVTDDH